MNILLISARKQIASGLNSALLDLGHRPIIMWSGTDNAHLIRISEPRDLFSDGMQVVNEFVPFAEIHSLYCEFATVETSKSHHSTFIEAEKRSATAYIIGSVDNVVNKPILLSNSAWPVNCIVSQWENLAPRSKDWLVPNWRYPVRSHSYIRGQFAAWQNSMHAPQYYDVQMTNAISELSIIVEMPSSFFACIFVGCSQWHYRSHEGEWVRHMPNSFAQERHSEMLNILANIGITVGQFSYAFNGQFIFWSATPLPTLTIMSRIEGREFIFKLANFLVRSDGFQASLS